MIRAALTPHQERHHGAERRHQDQPRRRDRGGDQRGGADGKAGADAEAQRRHDSSITIKGNGGVNVVTLPSLHVVNGTVTIQGTAADIFVINVAGKFELDGSQWRLTGGVRACNLLWNFTGSAISESNEVELENGSDASGIFLAQSRLVDLESSALQRPDSRRRRSRGLVVERRHGAGRRADDDELGAVDGIGIVIPNGTTVTQNFTLTPPPVDPCTAANAYFGLGPASSYTLLGIDVAGCAGTTIDVGGASSVIGGDLGVGDSVHATLEGGTVQGKLLSIRAARIPSRRTARPCRMASPARSGCGDRGGGQRGDAAGRAGADAEAGRGHQAR